MTKESLQALRVVIDSLLNSAREHGSDYSNIGHAVLVLDIDSELVVLGYPDVSHTHCFIDMMRHAAASMTEDRAQQITARVKEMFHTAVKEEGVENINPDFLTAMKEILEAAVYAWADKVRAEAREEDSAASAPAPDSKLH